MGIFIDNDGTSGVSGKDELIAILNSSILPAGEITNTTAGFSFV
jgi:hypothetical protein